MISPIYTLFIVHCQTGLIAGDWLIAGQGRVEDLSHHFKHQPGVSTGAYAVLMLVPIVAGIAGYTLYHFNNRPIASIDTPDGLLSQLCRLHHLSNDHQFLLQTIAEVARVENPAVLFVMPEAFDAAVASAAKQMRFSSRESNAIGQIRRQMFA